MSSPNGIDERFDDLVRELRSGRVAASPELRERVHTIAAQAPPPRPIRAPFAERFRIKRAVLVLAPACAVAAVSAALLHGLTSSGSQPVAADQAGNGAPLRTRQTGKSLGTPAPKEKAGSVAGGSAHTRALPTWSTAESAAAPPPSGRYQDYRVNMRVRVQGLDALSKSVVKAMRVTRSLGGYVANVRYSSPSTQHGDAVLLLRIPIANVQKAVLSYAGLGSLVAQHFSVIDVQKQYDVQVQRIADLRALIARLDAKLVAGGLTDVEKARTQEQLEYSRASLTRLTAENRTTLNHARLSTARLSLTTFHKKQKQIVPAIPSRFDRAIDDAGRVLAHEAVWFVYALLVGGPFALLALMALAAERSRRRRVERRLLAAAG